MPVATRKTWAMELQATHQVSVQTSCEVVFISRTAYYYRKRQVDDSEVIDALFEVSRRHPRWGFMKCFQRIIALGHPWNHKRVKRVYNELGLQHKCKRKQRLPVLPAMQ